MTFRTIRAVLIAFAALVVITLALHVITNIAAAVFTGRI